MIGQSASVTMTTVFDHPHAAPRLSPKSRLVIDTASSTAPGMSKRTPFCRSVSGRIARATTNADEAERHLGREDPAPPECLDHRCAHHHAEHRCPRTHERPVAEGLHPLLGLEHPVEHRHRGRPGGRADARTEDTEQDERRRVPGERDASGEDARTRESDEVDALVSPQVAGLAEGRADDRVREQRAGDDPRQRRLTRAEVVCDRRDRDREQRHGEADREETEERRPEDEPRVAMTRLDSRDDSVPQHERPRDDADFVETRRVDHEIGLMAFLARRMQVSR